MSAGSPAEVSAVGARLAAVRARVAAAIDTAGRASDEVTLIAVSKGHDVAAVCAAYDAGQRVFGESYVQEFVAKAAAIAEKPGYDEIVWHFVGHLQRNKMRLVVPWVQLAHSLDSAAGLAGLDRAASAAGRRVDVLLQVNIGDDPQKYGVDVADLPALVRAAMALPSLRLRGLMTILPLDVPASPLFGQLRALVERVARTHAAADFDTISMGMSDDFSEAIAQGATHIRVGTAIFGPRGEAGRG